MNKVELIASIIEKTGLDKKMAEFAVEAFTETVTEELKKGNRVQIVGFGSFEVIQRNSRMGINPQTKERIRISPTIAPKFKAGKALKDAVNNRR